MWCCLCGGSPGWHQIASAGVVRQSLGSASYHTLQSDMACMEGKIFRNMHSTSAAGVGQGLPLTGSYHDYRLGWIGWQICGAGAQAGGQREGCRCGKRPCVVLSPSSSWCLVERDTAASSSPTTASPSMSTAPLHSVTASLRHGPPEAAQLESCWPRRGGRMGYYR